MVGFGEKYRPVNTFKELAERDLVYSLSIGIDYDTFWKLCPAKLKLFAEADRIKTKNQDFMNYILGLYIRMSIASTLSDKTKYPQKPFLNNMDKEIEEQKFDGDLFMAQLKAWADKHNANYRAKKNVESESGVK